MRSTTQELEGTWEEIVARSAELAGRRVRVTVLPGELRSGSDAKLPAANRRLLRMLDEWERQPLPAEEIEALEEFPAFREANPIQLRVLDDQ